ncbi:hypothetical protein [Pseudomonas multiresinivorans]|uniref:Uncharacterized protein n=1 Tax=Pseudomonas multiresinivorans TaxID=95301 RepID=A0A7Z3GP45_9PSED|nr:hypothetical protein [Pseudomonas multiresinivorans]QJP07578.1 hypothetical protein G4G71_06640 [Pseudomonas multiresinivorans]
MQKVTVSGVQFARAAYYLAAIGFHWALFFTNIGNYYHGGTPFEWVALNTVAVLIVLSALRLVPAVRMPQKILIVLCAAVPTISIVWVLAEMVRR